jgi:hypothetical protein
LGSLLAQELRRSAVAIADARQHPAEGGIPGQPGFYAWWLTDRTALPEVPLAQDGGGPLYLLYVGIAPKSATSVANLRSRVLGQHVGGNLGSSTFRRSLAALLWEREGWTPRMTPSGKLAFSAEDNAALSRWQEHNLRVGWCVADDPWAREAALIGELSPPLNVESNAGHVFEPSMRKARARLAEVVQARV